MGHQRAAFEILTRLFTPQIIMQTPTGRMTLTWYTRFDTFVGIMGSFQTALPREWFSTSIEYWATQAAAEPENLTFKIEQRTARLRAISMEMSILFSKGARSELAGDEYFAEHRRLSAELHSWRNEWDATLNDPAMMVTDFDYKRQLGANDIVNPYAPGVLYRPPLFVSTILTCEWHSMVVMHESQKASGPGGELPSAVADHAYSICQIFEAVELWPMAPSGSLITIQSCLAIAALFVPRDARHHNWIRRKFALLETMG
jgi:hypothetical protein